MNLETLQEMWKTDSKLDDDLHDNDSLAIPQLHMKYMEFHNTYSLMKKERGTRNEKNDKRQVVVLQR